MAKYAIYGVILLGIAIGLSSCAGWSFSDIVQVRTPDAIQEQTGLPPSTSLTKATTAYTRWYQDTKTAGKEWKDNIERASSIRSLFEQLTLEQFQAFGPTIAGVPVIGPSLAMLLPGLLGVYLGKRGTQTKIDAAYDLGSTETIEKMQATKSVQ